MDQDVEQLVQRVRRACAISRLVGQAPSFLRSLAPLPLFAQSDAVVPITGETGTGKELRNEHASHQPGRDVDIYVLEQTPGSDYDPRRLFGLPAGRRTALLMRCATGFGYCLATWPSVEAFVRHGVSAVQKSGLDVALAAFDAGWRPSWGSGPGEPAGHRAGLEQPLDEVGRPGLRSLCAERRGRPA